MPSLVAVAERSNSESLKCGDKSESFSVVQELNYTFDFDEQEGEQGSDCEPEGEPGQVVKEGQGSGDFLHLGDCHLIRDGVVVYLIYGVAVEAVAVLD